MNTPISPWIDEATATSPDGESIARFHDGMEVAMGAPTMGALTVNRGGVDREISSRAAASMVWSDDSRFLAFSEWTRAKKQNLCVYRVADGTIQRSPDEFRVLELRGFSGGRISGVDSPVHMPQTFALAYNDEAEQGGGGQAATRAESK